jgi:APA family basic amino acid/polyamine antiporter
VHTPQLVLIAWVLGGIIALIGAFCFGELGYRRPRAGGGYVYLRETFGPLPAFLYGWTLVLVIANGAIAAVAVTFANYALALMGLGDRFTIPVAAATIILLTAINYRGVRPASITLNIFTLLKLVALAALIGVGIFLSAPATIAAPSVAPATPLLAIGSALVPVLFTYGGWQQTNFIAEEIVDPERTLPRALLLGVVIAVTVYLLTNVVYLRVLGATRLAASTAPAADVMGILLGPAGAKVMAAGIAVSTFGFLNLVILVTPRVLQAMAADGAFFRQLALLHPAYHTPATAIIALAVCSLVVVLTGTFAQLVDYVTVGDWIFFGLIVSSLFIYRARERSAGVLPSGFRVPGYPWTPALFVLAAAGAVYSAIASSPRNAAIGVGLVLLGIPAFLLWRRRP